MTRKRARSHEAHAQRNSGLAMEVEKSNSNYKKFEIVKNWDMECTFDVNVILTSEHLWPLYIVGTTEGNLKIFENKEV